MIDGLLDFRELVDRVRGGVPPYWTVDKKAHGSHLTQNGVAFAGRILRMGATVGWYEHDGNGGGVRFGWDWPATRDEWEAMVDRLTPGEFEGDSAVLEVLLQRAGV